MTTDVTTLEDQGMSVGLPTGTGNSFMEEVETYSTYKVASFINQYWFPILVPIGLIGNTLSFLVMIKPNNRKVSTCIYMAAISINDNLMMFLALYDWLVVVKNISAWKLLDCKIFNYFTSVFLQCSTYQILAMTFDKYIAIKWPHRASMYSTPRRAKIILLSIFICAHIYNGPHLLVSGLVGEQCVFFAVSGTVTTVFSWTSFIVKGIIPFSLLIHMNYVIVQTVRKSRKMFGLRVTTVGTDISPKVNKGKDSRDRTLKSAENQLTIMLLLVTTLFLILLIPTYLRFIYLSLVERDTPYKYASLMLFFQVTYKLYKTNNSINFFLYCISGKKFRDDLKEMLCCKRKMFVKTSECQSNQEFTLSVSQYAENHPTQSDT